MEKMLPRNLRHSFQQGQCYLPLATGTGSHHLNCCGKLAALQRYVKSLPWCFMVEIELSRLFLARHVYSFIPFAIIFFSLHFIDDYLRESKKLNLEDELKRLENWSFDVLSTAAISTLSPFWAQRSWGPHRQIWNLLLVTHPGNRLYKLCQGL